MNPTPSTKAPTRSPAPAEVRADFADLSANVSARRLVDGAPLPAVIVNEACQLVLANERFVHLIGASNRTELLGRCVRSVAANAGDSAPAEGPAVSPQPSMSAVKGALAGVARTTGIKLTIERPAGDLVLAGTIATLPLRRGARRFALLQFSPRPA